MSHKEFSWEMTQPIYEDIMNALNSYPRDKDLTNQVFLMAVARAYVSVARSVEREIPEKKQEVRDEAREVICRLIEDESITEVQLQ